MMWIRKVVLIVGIFNVWFNVYSQSGIFTLDSIQPTSKKNLEVVDHGYFRLGYDAEKKQSAWVAYLLTKEMVRNDTVKRTNDFREDTTVSIRVDPKNYKYSGYDRGHLCPAEDMAWSKEAMRTTFLMTNVSPQKHGFNSGKWEVLEEKVREWARDNDSIIVITGPVLDSYSKGEIGSSTKCKIPVPCRFYKIVIGVSYPTYKAIGFLMENAKLDKDICYYAVSIKCIEKVTNLNFFPCYDDDVEIQNLEMNRDCSEWK